MLRKGSRHLLRLKKKKKVVVNNLTTTAAMYAIMAAVTGTAVLIGRIADTNARSLVRATPAYSAIVSTSRE